MQRILDVEQLGYNYGDRIAAQNVSFYINGGEIFGLLGPNGAGKTTTISCIAGLLHRWTGDLRLGSKAFRPAVHVQDRKSIGLVPQELALYDNLTARENLELFAQLSGVRNKDLRAQSDKYLLFAGLTDRANDPVREFSGGMKRRLNLAAGIIHEPPLVLLDEPTVGVDPQSRNHLFDSILQLKERGISMLYTTHYMEEAQRLCDRVAIMNDGQIIAMGAPSDLIASIGIPNANLEMVFLHLTGRRLRDE